MEQVTERTTAKAIEMVIGLLEASRDSDYIGESISQLEHALQGAKLADDSGADEEMILAAMLHDIGHFCLPDSDPMGSLGAKDHEKIGAQFLSRLGFSSRVTRLIEGHVQAKRYLTFKYPSYLEKLSEASQGTLREQGGPMTPEEAEAFETDPLFREKLRMRAWDEQAKKIGWEVPGVDHYRGMLHRHLGGR